MKNVLIVGAFGYGNLGDNAVRDAEMSFFKSKGFEVDWDSPDMDIEKVNWADFVVIGGGGIIYDEDLRNLYNYTKYAREAKRQGKKYAFANIGTQGIRTKEGIEEYKEVMDEASAISVRDPYDKFILEKVVGVEKDIFIGEDSAWLLDVEVSNKTEDYCNLPIRIFPTSKPDIASIGKVGNAVGDDRSKVFIFSKEDYRELKRNNEIKERWDFLKGDIVEKDNFVQLAEKMNGKITYPTRFHGMIASVKRGIKVEYLLDDTDGKLILFYERYHLRKMGNKEYLLWVNERCKIEAKKGLECIL